jgi:hypothetical protein
MIKMHSRREFLLFPVVAAGADFLSCGGASSSTGGGSSGGGGGGDTPNTIVLENMKPGDPSWAIPNPAENREIEGYPSATSVNRGETISFFVNTADPSFTIQIFRMGWYGGAGARSVAAAVTLSGTRQVTPSPDPSTGRVECQWTNPYALTVPANPSDSTDWASGVYLAKLTAGTSGKQAYIIFVVRDDNRRSDLLFQASMNTYQAYNYWGGTSLYTVPPAVKVSFNRPYVRGWGSGDFTYWEYNTIRYLEREGYDVSYTCDVATHEKGDLLPSHKAFLVVGHNEYWSWQMRNNVENARDSGVNLGFFGANTCFWQIRYEASPLTGDPDRTIVGYKYTALTADPLAHDPTQSYLTTYKWRLPPINRPEAQMIGVMYNTDFGYPVEGDVVVSDVSNFVFQGTGLQIGDHLKGLLGYEVDRVYPGVSPAATTIVADSPYVNVGGTGEDQVQEGNPLPGTTYHSHMTYYTTPGGATVFATGSMQWNWGLDSFSMRGYSHSDFTNPKVQQAMRNILKQFGATGQTPQ